MVFIKKVSVIIPVYNAEKYLDECLMSVCGQTMNEMEVIIINDGSIDNSLEIVKTYTSIIPNLKVISTLNKGAGHARNIGLDNACGEFIKFLDADDKLPTSDTLEKLYSISSQYDIDVLVGKYYAHFGKMNLSGLYNTLGQEKSGIIDLEKNKSYPFEEMPGIGDKFFKRELIGNLRFSERKWEDLSFTPVLMADAKRLYFLNDIIYDYRMTIHNSSLNGCIHASNIFEFFDVYDDLKTNLKKRNIFQKYHEELLGLFSMHGHFDASYVPLWIDMKLEEKRNLLKYFIAKLEKEYPNFRNNEISKRYYDSHQIFFKLFKIVDQMARKSKMNIHIDTLEEDIQKFVSNSKILVKK